MPPPPFTFDSPAVDVYGSGSNPAATSAADVYGSTPVPAAPAATSPLTASADSVCSSASPTAAAAAPPTERTPPPGRGVASAASACPANSPTFAAGAANAASLFDSAPRAAPTRTVSSSDPVGVAAPPLDAACLFDSAPSVPNSTQSESAAPPARQAVPVSKPSRTTTQVTTVPDSLFGGGGAGDPFSSVGSAPAADLFATPAPGWHTNRGKTAGDVFDRPAPVVPNIPGAPPSAPGRHALTVQTAEPSITHTGPAGPSPIPAVAGAHGKIPGPPGSASGARSRGDSIGSRPPPPADHIPTPHGYVPLSAPSPASQSDKHVGKKAPVAPIAPTQSKVKKTSAAHFHHTVPLPSVVLPGTTAPSQSLTDSEKIIATGFTMHRGAYKPAPGPVVSFGFGGRMVVCFPRYQGGNVPTPFGAQPDTVHRCERGSSGCGQ